MVFKIPIAKTRLTSQKLGFQSKKTSTTYNHEHLYLKLPPQLTHKNNGTIIKVTYLSGVTRERWLCLKFEIRR